MSGVKSNIQSLPVGEMWDVSVSKLERGGRRSSVFSLRGEESVDSCKIVELSFTHLAFTALREMGRKYPIIDIIKYIDTWLVCSCWLCFVVVAQMVRLLRG